jgi:hypothetical protein
MANTQLSRTIGTATNGKKYTLSFWIKRSALGVEQSIVGVDSANLIELIKFGSNNKLYWYNRDNAGNAAENYTSNVFRDTSAWYHLVFSYDSTEGSAANQKKLYINGVAQTWGSTAAIQADAIAGTNFATKTFYFGREGGGTSYFLNGLMSHIHYIDGTVYTASNFGSTDSTTGEWKINTSPSVTYGNNGFFILKDSNSVTDQSGNSNNFTVAGGTLTNTEDCPSNNFANWNVLAPSGDNRTMGNGNTYIGSNSNNSWNCLYATLASSTGKFYCEIKDEEDWGSTSDSTRRYGIVNLSANINQNRASATDVRFSDNNYAYAYMNESGVRHSGSTISGTASTHPTFQKNDIIMIAMDLDNNKLYFGKNGTWNNSANPASGSTGTGSVADIADGTWTFYAETKYGSDNCSANFGNGYHRTTAISSEGTNASGIGKFEYDVPTGYTALSTKGLNL